MCCQLIFGIEVKKQRLLGIVDLGRSLMLPITNPSTRSPNLLWHIFKEFQGKMLSSLWSQFQIPTSNSFKSFFNHLSISLFFYTAINCNCKHILPFMLSAATMNKTWGQFDFTSVNFTLKLYASFLNCGPVLFTKWLVK